MRTAARRGARGPALVLALAALGLASASARADDVPLGFEGPLESALPAPWRSIDFPSIHHTTHYSIETIGSRTAVHAIAAASASFLIRRAPEDLSLERTPWLHWDWRCDRAVTPSDGRTRETDDFAARVWVGFETDWSQEGWFERHDAEKARERYGFEPPGYWIHYVWAGKRQHEEAFDEPYQPERVKCVALRSSEDALGVWFHEEREPAHDFERCFHRAAPRVTAIAIMTDADDTQGKAEAYYADLAFVGTR